MIPTAMKKATSQRRTNTTLIEPRATCLPTDVHVIPINQSPSACLKPNAMKHCMNNYLDKKQPEHLPKEHS